MPKRARCPHCDRLFSRDVLDEHVIRCRARTTMTEHTRTVERRRCIIIDGNNVAYYLAPDGQPRLENIVLARRGLHMAGYQTVTVVSAALVHKIDNPEGLEELLRLPGMVQSSRGQDDDLLIIRLAKERDADIVSNDRFLTWIDRYPWLPSRIRKYRLGPAGIILI